MDESAFQVEFDAFLAHAHSGAYSVELGGELLIDYTEAALIWAVKEPHRAARFIALMVDQILDEMESEDEHGCA